MTSVTELTRARQIQCVVQHHLHFVPRIRDASSNIFISKKAAMLDYAWNDHLGELNLGVVLINELDVLHLHSTKGEIQLGVEGLS